MGKRAYFYQNQQVIAATFAFMEICALYNNPSTFVKSMQWLCRGGLVCAFVGNIYNSLILNDDPEDDIGEVGIDGELFDSDDESRSGGNANPGEEGYEMVSMVGRLYDSDDFDMPT